MAKTHEEILAEEKRSLEGHARKYRVYFSFQALVLGVAAVSGSINAFAQSRAAQGTPYANPDLLFWTGVLSALTAVIIGLGLTAEVAKQRSRREFHKLIVGKLTRRSIMPEEAERVIDEYFEKWRN